MGGMLDPWSIFECAELEYICLKTVFQAVV